MGHVMKEWFPHDYTAAADPKARVLMRRGGATYYGLYWHLVEMLHSERELSADIAIDALVMGTNTAEDVVTAFLELSESIGLVRRTEDNALTIDRVTRNLSEREGIRDKRQKAAARRWKTTTNAPQDDANAMQMHSKCNAHAMLRQDNTIQDNTIQVKKETTSLALIPSGIRADLPALKTNRGDEWPIMQDDVDRWQTLYPAVDVPQALRNIAGWLDANPTKRKTAKGMARFINSWLTREQDKPHGTTQSKRSTGDRVVGTGDVVGYAADVYADRERNAAIALRQSMARRTVVAVEARPEDRG